MLNQWGDQMSLTFSTGPLERAPEVDQLHLKILNNHPKFAFTSTVTIYNLNGPKQIFLQRHVTLEPLSQAPVTVDVTTLQDFEVQFWVSDPSLMFAIFAVNKASGKIYSTNSFRHGEMMVVGNLG